MSYMKRWLERHPEALDGYGEDGEKMLDTTISDVLDKHKPVGATWVVLIDDEGFKSSYGPFDRFDEAFAWTETHGGEVIPLYVP